MRAHPAPMFPIITVGPFTKWGIDYTTCHPPSARGHHYIIVAVDYFTKWVEAMPTFKDDGETTTLFLFNQIIARFDIPKEIVTDHGSHFQNKMMSELTSNLGLRQEHSSPYYPQANGQVEAVNKSLKTILQRTINSGQVKLAFDVVLNIVGLPNICKDCNQFLTFSTHLRAGSSLAYRMPDPISKVGSTVIARHFTA
jgi:hypothetical protein